MHILKTWAKTQSCENLLRRCFAFPTFRDGLLKILHEHHHGVHPSPVVYFPVLCVERCQFDLLQVFFQQFDILQVLFNGAQVMQDFCLVRTPGTGGVGVGGERRGGGGARGEVKGNRGGEGGGGAKPSEFPCKSNHSTLQP
jgi:uncharacterized membrane protein YgcG